MCDQMQPNGKTKDTLMYLKIKTLQARFKTERHMSPTFIYLFLKRSTTNKALLISVSAKLLYLQLPYNKSIPKVFWWKTLNAKQQQQETLNLHLQ